MLNKITDFVDTHPIGRIFQLGKKNTVWKRVNELKPGVKIATENDGKLEWDEIVSIKKVGRERVYDIEVKGTHNFVGNGIIAHNTIAAIFNGGNVGIGTTGPNAKLDVVGDATISGNLTFYGGARTIASRLNTTLTIGDAGTGNISLAPQNGAVGGTVAPSTDNQVDLGQSNLRWRNLYAGNVVASATDGTQGFWQRTTGALSPTTITDSINIGNAATASAFVHLGGKPNENSFINNGYVGIGTTSTPVATLDVRGNLATQPAANIQTTSNSFAALIIKNAGTYDIFTASSSANTRLVLTNAGNLMPGGDVNQNIGSGALRWNGVYANFAQYGSSVDVNIQTHHLGGDNATIAAGNPWTFDADASVSGQLVVAGCIIGGACAPSTTAVIKAGVDGTGKIDVGTVDPPYTINGDKYATYLPGMVGQREEVTGQTTTAEYIPNVGFRQTINFTDLAKASDLWLFAKVTNLKDHISDMSVILSPGSSARAWYELDPASKTLYIYSTKPSLISYRLSAPRFDAEIWGNTRPADSSIGFILNDPDQPQQINNQGQMIPPTGTLVFNQDQPDHFTLTINNQLIQEIGSFANAMVANLTAGLIKTQDLVVSHKLISPLADFDLVTVASLSAQTITATDATISGTLYAANIVSPEISNFKSQISNLTENYATASSILASIQDKYKNFDSLVSSLQTGPNATISGNYALNSNFQVLTSGQIVTDTLMVNTTLLTNSLNSIDTALYLQPTGNQPINLLAGLMVLTPDGKVVINGDLAVTGNLYANKSQINSLSLGTPSVPPPYQGGGQVGVNSKNLLTLYDENGTQTGSLNASGSAEFTDLSTNNIVTQNLIIAQPASASANVNATSSATINSNASISSATLKAGQTQLEITNSSVSNSTYIYLTPISDTQNQVLFVKSKNEGIGFTVAINQPINSDLTFNYWLIRTQ